MDYNKSSINVFLAITHLSERVLITNGKINNRKNIAQLRNKAFEILLSKGNAPATTEQHSDVFCQLLSWKFYLINKHNLHQHVAEIDKYVNILKSSMPVEVLRGVLIILLQLKQLPKQENNISELGDISKTYFKVYKNNDFKFEETSLSSVSSFDLKSFQLPDEFKQKKKSGSTSSYSNIQEICGKRNDDEFGYGYLSSIDLWDQLWKFDKGKIKTWESYSLFNIPIEKPFFIELPTNLYSQLLNNHIICLKQIFSPRNIPKITQITQMQFIKDVKNILFGVVSETFLIDKDGNFVLSDNVLVENISNLTIEAYCEDILFCGNSYKNLYNLIEIDPYTGQHKYNGFIFMKFCESIKKYLFYYKVTVISISEHKGFFYFCKYIRKFSMQLQTLASLRNYSLSEQGDKISHGVALLNFLYHKILVLDNTENLVLNAIVYPCVQIYFEKFLKLWILDGKINDPYNEFFIISCPKYENSRGRTYWTRSYLIKKDLVPDFLSGIEEEILNCGKAMNLLKLCSSNSNLGKYFRDPNLNMIQCCLTAKELENLEESVRMVYLDVLCTSGPRFSIHEFIQVNLEKEIVINNLISTKRKLTVQRYENERVLKQSIEMNKRRQEIITFNIEKEKIEAKTKELRNQNKVNEQTLINKAEKARQLEDKILKNESENLIKYYNTLFEEVEERDKIIKRHNIALKIQLEQNISRTDNLMIDEVQRICNEPTNERKEDNLDIINANISTISDVKNNFLSNENSNIICLKNNNANTVLTEDLNYKNRVITGDFCLKHQLNKNNKAMSEAQKNKTKMMNIEFGTSNAITYKSTTPPKNKKHLSDADKNKLKVMSSEYYSQLKDNMEVMRQSPIHNVNEVVGKNLNIYTKTLSTLDELNENFIVPARKINIINKKTELNSTSNSEMIGKNTFRNRNCEENVDFMKKAEIFQTTTSFKHSFNFSLNKDVFGINPTRTLDDKYCKEILKNWNNYFIKQSIIASTMIHKDLLQNKLLKYFIEDLKFLTHLESLRNFFFLLDGEFGKNITEGMFIKLYDSNLPKDLINLNTLQHLVCSALNMTSKLNENSNNLSIKINNLPKCFNLSDVSVLDCLSLSYKILWPLNILLPCEAISKYEEVFKFLLKIHRMNWILKNIFMDLKILTKEVGKRESFLLLSYHFQCIQQCRHVMTHFIQTVQNYIIGEVLQSSWVTFEKSLKSDVQDLDQLYYLHSSYLKSIVFLCWLNQRSLSIQKVLHNIFITIIKFYDYLRSRPWEFNTDSYHHPNFEKLLDIFNNFLNLVQYLFKMSNKVAKVGYQPELVRLLDMLNVNEYYSNLNLKNYSSTKE